MPDSSTTVIIFGATGDLTSRKLIPSLHQLAEKQRLPENLRILGVSRSDLDDASFRDKVTKELPDSSPSKQSKSTHEDWTTFCKRVHYTPGDTSKEGGLDKLEARLREWEGDGGGNRLFYIALSPRLYEDTIVNLAGMVKQLPTGKDTWDRVVIEKPFGHDLASAKELNEVVLKHFREEQVFRIDHYLGKETVQNLLVFRFANILFEPLWNRTYIDHVQITVNESGLVGDRGSYYDKAGVLRDMFQNHLLQLLTMVAMEAPSRVQADPLRNEKIKVLDSVVVWPVDEAKKRVVLGQYQGYHDEKGVDSDSKTPTFAALELRIDNQRWKDVPIFLRSGKGLTKRHSEIVIQFHCPAHMMFAAEEETITCNRLAICVQPDEGIHLNFQTKVPDRETTILRPADMEFHYRTTYGEGVIPEAYERLLQDAIEGDASLFMRKDEIERAWEILTPFLEASESQQSGRPRATRSAQPARRAAMPSWPKRAASGCRCANTKDMDNSTIAV